MFRHILVICLYFIALQVEMLPVKNHLDFLSESNTESSGKFGVNKHKIVHPAIKESTDAGKSIQILVNPDMTIEDLKLALLKKKSEFKDKSVKPIARIKVGKSELNGKLILNQSSNIAKNKEEPYAKLVLNDKSLNTNKKAKPLSEPVFVLLDDRELALSLNGDNNCTVPEHHILTTTEEVGKTVEEEKCEQTTHACIDLMEHTEYHRETSPPCRKTSIICIDLLNEQGTTDKEQLRAEEPVTKSAFEKVEKIETTIVNSTTEGAVEEVFELAVDDSSPCSSDETTIVTHDSTAETSACAEIKHHEIQNTESDEENLQDLLNKQKIEINLGIGNEQTNVEPVLKTALGGAILDDKPHTINGSIRFFINNNTDADVFLDGSEELELAVP